MQINLSNELPTTPSLQYIQSLPLVAALWWFIENVPEDAMNRSELFFALRERYRNEVQGGGEMFAIMCSGNNDLMWSNEFGWVDTPTFDLFTREERDNLNLPHDGRWVQMTWQNTPTAQQPPAEAQAQGGGDAVKAVYEKWKWLILSRCADEFIADLHALTAPPSAPVGVEGLLECLPLEVRSANGYDAAWAAGFNEGVLQSRQNLRRALAQQPAACPKCDGTGEADSGGIMPWGAPATIPCDCQQPAAVDEAIDVLWRAVGKADRNMWADTEELRDAVGVVTAALAAQPEAPTMSDNKKNERFKHSPYSDEWWGAAGEVALKYVGEIKTCRDCDGPVVTGYCCLHCGSSSP